MSPAHRAAIRFLRGGLVAVVALLLPSRLGGWLRDWPMLEPIVALAQVAIPVLGFAAAGAIGATSLDRGRRGIAAFAVALAVTGLGVSLTAPQLQNLTGFESAGTVVLFAAAATGAAFAVGGGIAALWLEPERALPIAAGFAAGGAFGGLVTVLPSLLARAVADWPPEAQLFVRLACSLAGLLGPFAIGGAAAGRGLGEAEAEGEGEGEKC